FFHRLIKTSEIKKSITKIDITGRTYRIQHYNFTPAIGCMFIPPPLKVIPAKIIKVSPIRVPAAFSPCVNYSLVKPFCLAFFIATEIVRHRKTKENFRLRFIRSLIARFLKNLYRFIEFPDCNQRVSLRNEHIKGFRAVAFSRAYSLQSF